MRPFSSHFSAVVLLSEYRTPVSRAAIDICPIHVHYRSKKVCNVAPLAGETKVWQYVNLMKSIFLIDCPGVVYPDGATEAELVMKGVVSPYFLSYH